MATCPTRRFTPAEGAEGHCEGMAPIVFWTAAFDLRDPGAHRPLCQCSLQCGLVATNVQWRATN